MIFSFLHITRYHEALHLSWAGRDDSRVLAQMVWNLTWEIEPRHVCDDDDGR